MSYIAIIVGLVFEVLSNITNWTASAIILAASNRAKDSGAKNALKAAFWFSLLTIPFVILAIITMFRFLATRGCKKHKPWLLIISLIAIVICLIISIVICIVYANKAKAAGDTDTERDLLAAYRLMISSIILAIIGFIILYIAVGRRVARLGQECRQVRAAIGK